MIKSTSKIISTLFVLGLIVLNSCTPQSQTAITPTNGTVSTPIIGDNSAPPASITYPVTFKTQEILDFTQTDGKPSFITDAKNNIQGAIWTFNADGTFSFMPSNVRTDIYPIKGNYQKDATKITFSGSNSVAIGTTGTTSVVVEGKIDISVDPKIMTITWLTTSDNKAVINGTPFASSNKSGYTARISLK